MLVTNGPASLGASTLFTLEDDLMFAALPQAPLWPWIQSPAPSPVQDFQVWSSRAWSSRMVATAAESRLSI